MKSDRGAALAQGISRIHRSDSLEALMQAFLSVAPQVVDADAFGLYVLDSELQARAIYVVRADRRFLAEYERLRMCDPCFLHLLRHRSFIHTREILTGRAWDAHPLHELMSRWGLRYSIEAPLIAACRLAGTLNIARRDRGYFDHTSLARARFLCEEMAFAFERIARVNRLEQELARATGPRAGAAPAYIEAAVGHMRAHCAEPLTTESVAAASGVSSRTLIAGFRRHLGASPKALLREFRFQHVRDALVAALPGSATVADIATACGFNELGRFAIEYRQRYQETPSATLRRAALPSDGPRAMPKIFVLPEVTARQVRGVGACAGRTA
jgi:AraC-like DNA-binding protein